MRALNYIGYGDPSPFAPMASDKVYAVLLSANVSQLVAIPAGSQYAVFSLDGDFYAKFGVSDAVAAVPTVSTTDGLASELNPTARRIPPNVTHIALIAEAAYKGSISFYG